MHTGHISREIKPSWEPLFGLMGKELVPSFMWMFAIELDDGTEVHAYKHAATRHYLHVAGDGRTFTFKEKGRYLEIGAREALEDAYRGWEDVVSQPQQREAVRALLDRHRAEMPAS